MATELEILIRKRGNVKASVTRFTSFLSKFENAQEAELKVRLESQDKLLRDFETVQERIEELHLDDQKNHDEREEFENVYYKNIASANSILKRLTTDTQSVSSNGLCINENANNSGAHEQGVGAVRLPTINLPDFDGNYESWYKFRDAFQTLVHENSHLSDVQKFMYLNLSLKGSAAEVIQSLEVSSNNYATALELLKDRFENKRIIVNTHMRALNELEAVSRATSKSLRQLLDGFLKHFRALKALALPVEHWDVPMVYILSNKLDHYTRSTWEQTASVGTELPKLEALITFLKGRCQMLETMSNTSPNVKTTDRYASKPKTLANAAQKFKCTHCKAEHLIYQCKSFLDKTPEERARFIREAKGCTNCLSSTHTYQQCKSQRNCFKCNKRHHTLLHLAETTKIHEARTIASHAVNKTGHILLSTATIYLKDREGHTLRARALVDNGSDSNYITEKLFNQTGLKHRKIQPIQIAGVNGTSSEVARQACATIKSVHSNYEVSLMFLIVRKITEQIPIIALNTEHLRIPDGINLADPSFNKPGNIDLLIGAEIFYDLIESGKITLGRNQPVLRESKLGWLVTGRLDSSGSSRAYCHLSLRNEDLHQSLEHFWNLDDCPQQAPLNTDAARCEEDFKAKTTRDETGRYIVALPFNEKRQTLGDNLHDAWTRFKKLEARLENNSELGHQYRTFMSEYQDLGHMERICDLDSVITSERTIGTQYYIPHHPVFKNASTTTKLRVVFDASAQTNTGVSLNNTLLVGPIVQSDLFTILIRFRRHSVALVADIEKMFRQVKITPEHRDFQRVLWREDTSHPVGIYQLCTVTYGTAPATFLTTRCLKDVAERYAEQHPLASRAIIEDMYVDDLITGANDLESAIQLQSELSVILKQAGFNLRKWGSNLPEALKGCTTAAENDKHIIKDATDNRTLGMIWISERDTLKFVCDFNTSIGGIITKRGILSTISKVFDPLGLISPIVIDAKVLVQQLWLLKLGWDEAIPQEAIKKWRYIESQIQSLHHIEIPRQASSSAPVAFQLCAFCDSSEKAYAAAIYIRSVDASNNIRVALLCSKTRVAPLKNVSLPRLELCGALLLAKLASNVSQMFKPAINRIFYFTDSSIVINWINAEPSKWKTFVANRVAKIQTLTNVADWHHIAGKNNPADIATRGLTTENLINSIWFTGPEFLMSAPETWPVNVNIKLNESQEVRTKKLTFTAITDIGIFGRYSSLMKLKHVMAYLLRFRRNTSIPSNSRTLGFLTCEEVDNAMTVLIRMAQRDAFQQEISALSRSEYVHKRSTLRCLNPFLDDDGVLRVGGRLRQADIDFDKKHQIILPKRHSLTKLVILYEHNRHFHAGVQATLSAIRQRYWPVDGKNTVKHLIRSCVICFKYRPKHIQVQMADLPKTRITPARAFLYTSLDMAGPFQTKESKLRNKRIIKSYVCVFVCFVTKAVHLEIVSDLSCEHFLNALTRFVARRGLPKQLYSDNGKAFVAADKVLRESYKIMIQYHKDPVVNEYLTQNSILWKFMPPRAPHFGGLHEAAVKSMKTHLKKVVSDRVLTVENLVTLLCKIESILNSRPLHPLSDDPSDLNVLTPGHFLIGAPMTAIPERDVTDRQPNRLRQYEQLQLMQQNFWRRWRFDYLTSLQTRVKWTSDTKGQPNINDIVLLKEDHNVPPQHWPLARIIQLHPGPDGRNRVATILCQGKEKTRSIAQLCPLPKENVETHLDFKVGRNVSAKMQTTTCTGLGEGDRVPHH